MEASFPLNLPVGVFIFPIDGPASHGSSKDDGEGKREQDRKGCKMGWWQLKPLPVL